MPGCSNSVRRQFGYCCLDDEEFSSEQMLTKMLKVHCMNTSEHRIFNFIAANRNFLENEIQISGTRHNGS